MPGLPVQGLAARTRLSPDPTDGGDWKGPAGRILLWEERVCGVGWGAWGAVVEVLGPERVGEGMHGSGW